MKLFQQLLVAPAALGLIAPLAANAADVNINDVASYTTAGAEVTTAQFSDVIPGDWAYTALQNLSESYGCVDNAYTQNLKSGQALTRYEAAALVNACLDGGIASAEINADAARLASEFGTEMAILKGRVDGLEYKVKELSAGQFSSTTKMSGGAVFTTGLMQEDYTNTADDKLISEYNLTIDLNTSFNGDDGLYAGLSQGNQDDLVMDSSETNSSLTVHSLFYTFPVGDFQVTAGPLLDSDDVISATTSLYSGAFRLSAMPWGSDGDTTGAGAAIAWQNDSGFNASFSTVSANGADATRGIGSSEGNDKLTFAVGYDADNYGGGIIITDSETTSSTAARSTSNITDYSSIGYGVYFRPDGFPTISVAYDTKDPEAASTSDSSSLLIGLDHPIGPGTASVAYLSTDTAGTDHNSYELYYNYPVADGIDVKAGIFVEEQIQKTNAPDRTGYVVETSFSF